jgi:hypothetical protein
VQLWQPVHLSVNVSTADPTTGTEETSTHACALTLRVAARTDADFHPIQRVIRVNVKALTLSLVTLAAVTYRQVSAQRARARTPA